MNPWRFAGEFPRLPVAFAGATGADTSYPLEWTNQQARDGEWGWKTVRLQAQFTVNLFEETRVISFDASVTPTPGATFDVLAPNDLVSGGRAFEFALNESVEFGSAADRCDASLIVGVTGLYLKDGKYFKRITVRATLGVSAGSVGVGEDYYLDLGSYGDTPPDFALAATMFGAAQNLYTYGYQESGFPADVPWSGLDAFSLSASESFAAP